MALLFNPVTGTDNVRFDGTPPVSGRPMSMACHFNKTAAGVGACIWIGDKDSFGKYYALQTNGGTNWGARVTIREQVGGDSGEVNFETAGTSDGSAQNSWNFMGGAIDASNVFVCRSHTGGADFTTANPANTTDDPGSFDRVGFGVLLDSSKSNAFTGSIGEGGIWDVMLTEGEFRILAAGISPLRVRPGNLKIYIPGIGVDALAIDYSGGGFNLSPFNNDVSSTIVYSDHAPVGPMFGFDAAPIFVASSGALKTFASVSTALSTGVTDLTLNKRALDSISNAVSSGLASTIDRNRSVDSVSSTISTTASIISRDRSVDSITTATSSEAADAIRNKRALEGSLNAISTGSGSLEIAGTVSFEGVSSVASSTTTSLSRDRSVDSISSAISTTVAKINRNKGIDSLSSAISTVLNSEILISRGLNSTTVSLTTITGEFIRTSRSLNALSNSASLNIADLNVIPFTVIGSVDGLVTLKTALESSSSLRTYIESGVDLKTNVEGSLDSKPSIESIIDLRSLK